MNPYQCDEVHDIQQFSNNKDLQSQAIVTEILIGVYAVLFMAFGLLFALGKVSFIAMYFLFILSVYCIVYKIPTNSKTNHDI